MIPTKGIITKNIFHPYPLPRRERKIETELQVQEIPGPRQKRQHMRRYTVDNPILYYL